MQKFLPIILAAGLMAASAHASSIEEDTCNVAGAAASTPSSEFTATGDGGTVLHGRTGLEWQRCHLGQKWDNDICIWDAATHAWEDALAAAEAVPGWRLPSRDELLTIVEACRTTPAINLEVFPEAPAVFHWTSSDEGTGNAWAINFRNGRDYWNDKGIRYPLRLVRPAE